MNLLAATSSFVYATPRADATKLIPCLVRFPIDASGLGAPDELCQLGQQWGKYPEMKTFADALVLHVGDNLFGFRTQPDRFGSLQIPASYDIARGLTITNSSLGFLFSDLRSGESIGHVPAQVSLATAVR